MKQKIMRTFLSLLMLPIIAVISILFLTITGCDEGMDIVGPVVTPPVEEPGQPQDPTEPVEPEPEPQPIETVVGTVNPEDIAGQVFLLTTQDRADAKTLAGVLVTIASGPRAGEKFLTDSEGQYVFRDIDGDKLHLRAEKDGLEPKEVIIHRSERTTLCRRNIF